MWYSRLWMHLCVKYSVWHTALIDASKFNLTEQCFNLTDICPALSSCQLHFENEFCCLSQEFVLMYPALYFLYLVQHSNILLERYIFVWYFMCFSSFDISTEACSVLYTAVLDSFGLFGPAWEYTGSQSNKSPPPEWWMFCLLFVLFFEFLFENSWQWFLLSSHFKELLMKFVWTFCLAFGFTSICGTAPVQGACTMSIIWPIY